MSDFSVRSDNVDVEQIMRQIRARIREKRGVDYTEEEIRELANVKLEKFIDPKGVRSNLLEEYRRLASAEPAPPNFAFEEDTLYESHRAPIRWLRALLRPFLKLLFNPNPLIQALHIQSQLNQRNAERHARLDALHYEVMHNLVLELTRTGVEVKSLKMRLESMASRLDFDERRARALEGVVQYRPGAVPPLQPPPSQEPARRDQGRRDGRRDQRDQGPRDQGQRDRGPRDQRPRDQGPRDQGPRDQAPREQAPRDQAPREQAPREQAPREQAPRDQAPHEQAPREQAPREQPAAQDSALLPQRPQGVEANALDNDGNERRARRRRRRGRRRGGEDRGGAFAGGAAGGGVAEARPAEAGGATTGDRGSVSEDRLPPSGEPGEDPGAWPEDQGAAEEHPAAEPRAAEPERTSSASEPSAQTPHSGDAEAVSPEPRSGDPGLAAPEPSRDDGDREDGFVPPKPRSGEGE